MSAGDAPTPVVELRQAALTYPGTPPVQALLPCDLSIHRGDLLTVVGPSGAGKSTFLNVLGLLDIPTAGTYLLDGIDVGELRDGERTTIRGRKIGFVFQFFHLLPHRPAWENVALALAYQGIPSRQRQSLAHEALEKVGLAHRLHSMPTKLSGGERQRVAIARALVGRPSLLLCDEPTGNLDTMNAEAILCLLDELNRSGVTIVVITHDSSVARHGRRSVGIKDGVMTELVQI
ncbi:ABC transporter ATP-binding protein [Streptomyces sp. NPDC050085]|uniref:ABC transporter ATP-binding protein n=1 Tax=Streptomyces sp. NPDC050085 TaxID=3365600 RepID=UPI00378AD9DB